MQARQQEIWQIWREYVNFYHILGGLVLVSIGVFIGNALFHADEGYITNLYTEFISIVTTVFILDYINRWRETQRRDQELKERLVREVGSSQHATSIPAIEVLRRNGWLSGENGLLQNAHLKEANLHGAHLQDANLRGTKLMFANLQEVEMERADLQGAYLRRANLQAADLASVNLKEAYLRGADLRNANLMVANLEGARMVATDLQGADLTFANLQSAELMFAKLQGANLSLANFTGANFLEAEFNEDTILPDGTNWTPETTIEHFTSTANIGYWQSDDLLDGVNEDTL